MALMVFRMGVPALATTYTVQAGSSSLGHPTVYLEIPAGYAEPFSEYYPSLCA